MSSIFNGGTSTEVEQERYLLQGVSFSCFCFVSFRFALFFFFNHSVVGSFHNYITAIGDFLSTNTNFWN